jgi:glucan phosphoethanolaminetransferase (alkaline phosphatase superfamily)
MAMAPTHHQLLAEILFQVHIVISPQFSFQDLVAAAVLVCLFAIYVLFLLFIMQKVVIRSALVWFMLFASFFSYHNSMCKCLCFDNQQTNQVQMCLDKEMGLPREVLRMQGLQHIKCVGPILMVEVDVLIATSWQQWMKRFMMERTS